MRCGKDPYSETLLTQAKRKRTVLRRWWNREQAPFGRCLRSTGSPFPVFGPTTENERVCIVTERANGTTKLPIAEDRSVRRPAHEERGGRARADRRAPSQIRTATQRTGFNKRCAVRMEASAIHPAYIRIMWSNFLTPPISPAAARWTRLNFSI